MEIINLSLEKIKKVSKNLPEKGLKHYSKLYLTEVSIKETYTFILPVMARNKNKDFFILQCNNAMLGITDWNYAIHYGIYNNIKNFIVLLHYSFYGKAVNVVIFEHNGNTEYGILYENHIYHQPDVYYNTKTSIDFGTYLKNKNFNMFFKLKELKNQRIYVDEYEHSDLILDIDLSKMYYFNTLFYDDGNRYVNIDEHNMEFFKNFYVNYYKDVAISEIKIVNKDIEKYKINIDKFFNELKKRDKKLNVDVEFNVQYSKFSFIDYISNFEPSITNLSNELITELKEYFEISKNRYYNLYYKNK